MSANVQQLRDFLKTFPEKTLQKGRKIYEASSAESYDDEEIELINEGPRSAKFIVPSQSGGDWYDVKLSWTAVKVTGSCDCLAFEDYGPCKHIVAAIYYLLNESGDSERNGGIEEAVIVKEQAAQPQKEEPATEPGRVEKNVLRCRPNDFFKSVDWRIGSRSISMAELRKIISHDFRTDEGVWNFSYRQTAKELHYPRITYDKQERFHLSCTCPERGICRHLFAACSWLYDKYDARYFIQFKDFKKEKQEALAKLGLSPNDPEAAEVTFVLNSWGDLQMQVPGWLWQANGINANMEHMQQQLGLKTPDAKSAGAMPAAPPKEFRPAIVLQTATGNLPFIPELVVVNTADGKFVKMALHNPERWPELKAALPRDVYEAVISISLPRLNAILKAEGYYEQLPNAAKHLHTGTRAVILLQKQYYTALRQLWSWLSRESAEVYTTADSRTSRNSCSRIRLHPAPVSAGILIRPSGKFIELKLQYHEAETDVAIEGRLLSVGDMLLRRDDTWYLPADEKTLKLLQQFPAGFIKIPVAMQDAVFSSLLPSLRSEYAVEIDETFRPEKVTPEPVASLHLTEHGNKHLVLMPRFSYEGQTFYYDASPEPILCQSPAGRWQEIIRDGDAEQAFAESIRALHPLFTRAEGMQAFFIPFTEALHDSWYQKMLAEMAERNIAVTGLDALQHFRYNPNTASVSVSSSEGGSGIDWFDLLIEISFGDQQVSLKEVRRALMQGQAGVRLGDGTIGLLPEEFVQQYGTLLKLGTESKEGRLRLNKLHFTLIDTLHEAALSKDLSAEIAAKKAKLLDVENIRTADVPKAINATLRPYQAGGYQWMQVLGELGWGGCLADDMGLGKTLQTITFLQYLQEQHPGSLHLVVCPTSLIYNWQAELDKFAPSLRYHIHYGKDRVWDTDALKEKDIVITSYGIIRSDLEAFVTIPWHYVVLDESQAIKNPDAQTTKAVQALPARNRLALSGTPLQNNTYDLYAQFQFLNPGLLGSREFFRTEFANPIDKKGEEGPRATLRRMLAPFMLRRTKEQVAQDLPDKTEAILWCEMEEAQRAVYDEYRRYYRDSLLKRIDEAGMAGSAIYVLEALLRLRQLCDHPALVKNESVKTSESVKLDELRREIREGAGGRKLLVFSQFTEMLALIAEALKEDGISFTYLDGKTPADKRAAAVDKFQTDPSVQVFLISLKAGGVGLNLTAAEYVYLVDPWWNPAVEAQAIDRTHRIGQTNKIVAYRLICKDTVEEKVMQLQARKRALAEGLVTEDAGFVKKLTREDVAFLLE